MKIIQFHPKQRRNQAARSKIKEWESSSEGFRDVIPST